jgi:hypothetical protein
MGKLSVTKWVIIGISAAIIATFIGRLGDYLDRLLIEYRLCAENNPLCFIKWYGIFFAVLLGIALSIDFLRLYKIKIVAFFQNIKYGNLHIFCGLHRDNILDLVFFTTEWRYIFKKTSVYGTIVSIDGKYQQFPYEERKYLKWKRQIPYILKIIRFYPYPISFLEIDSEKNELNIITIQQNYFNKLKSGKHVLELEITIAIDRIRNINDRTSSIRPIYLLIDYRGGNDIDVKLLNKGKYERLIREIEKSKGE